MEEKRNSTLRRLLAVRVAGGPVSIQPLDEVDSSMQYYLSLQILIFFLYFI